MTQLIQLSGIGKSFLTQEIETRALSDISLSINQGEYIAFTGPSGCGKSTLLSILGLLDFPSIGEYHLDGLKVSDLSRQQKATIRSEKIGFVFQSFNLISDLTVYENVVLPLTYQKSSNRQLHKQKVKEVLERVEMTHRANHFPSQLSGGQQQRVAVARALVNNPAIILADEPTGNLDSKNAQSVLKLLEQLNREGSTICMVTHDPRSSESCTRNINLLDGRLVKDEKKTISNNAFQLESVLA